jgi:cytosine/uracil/thiamine/allantoin permease
VFYDYGWFVGFGVAMAIYCLLTGKGNVAAAAIENKPAQKATEET